MKKDKPAKAWAVVVGDEIICVRMSREVACLESESFDYKTVDVIPVTITPVKAKKGAK